MSTVTTFRATGATAVLPKDANLLAVAKNPKASREELFAVLDRCLSWYDHALVQAHALRNLCENHLSEDTFLRAAKLCRLRGGNTPTALWNRIFDELAPEDDPAREIYLSGAGTWEQRWAASFVHAYPRFRTVLWPWFVPVRAA